MKSAVDIVGRFFFAWFVAYAPYAAFTNSKSVSAQYVIVDGWGSYVVFAGMVVVSGLILLDILCNNWIPVGWHWITKHRVPLYLAGSALQVAPAFQVSKFLYLEAATIYFITGLAAWGISLALLDIFAAGRCLGSQKSA